MVSITLSVPEEVKRRMEQFPEMNWSGFVRSCVEQKTEQLSWKQEMLNKLKAEEEFTEWAVEAQRESRTKRLKELRKRGLV